MWPPKHGFLFLQILGAVSRSPTALGAIFVQIFSDFGKIFRNLGIFPDLQQIKTFWGALSRRAPCLLRYTTAPNPTQIR